MKDPFPIPPFTTPASARVTVPGSKSITNRALLLAALSEGESVLENCLFSRDTEIMLRALQNLGFVTRNDSWNSRIEIKGLGGSIPNATAKLDIGNSGTSARFLTAMLATRKGGEYELDGDEAMRKRPMQKLAETLSSLGCGIETTNGSFPIRIRPQGLQGGTAIVDATESSQFVSALLMAAPLANGPLEIRLSNPSVRRGYIDLTIKMMERFGALSQNALEDDSGYAVSPSTYKAPREIYAVESDASAASYFIALPCLTSGSVTIEGVSKDSLQGDIAFASIVAESGASLDWNQDGLTVSFDRNSQSLSPLSANYYRFSDTFMTGAAISPLANGETRIEDIGHTRIQECDRVDAMAKGLAQTGQGIEETESTLTIAPKPLTDATIETFEDHRIAMSFAILGCVNASDNGKPWLSIVDPLCCRKTFPDFFETLESARQQSLETFHA